MDVAPEREAALRVVSAINASSEDGPLIDIIRWEDSYYTADATFQAQISEPGACDLVVCAFWKTLGSDLPEQYRKPDGRLPTGSEYEFENALKSSLASAERQPDVLVYRKTKDVFFHAETVDLEKAQQERFLAFWERWFRNEQGHFVAGFHSFKESDDFETLFEEHLRQWISRRERRSHWTGQPPYRGLKPFDVSHSEIFFGRSRDTMRARARLISNALKDRRFLAILGPSGSGKSSLLRAGLIAHLKDTRIGPEHPVLSDHLVLRPSELSSQAGAGWPEGMATALLATPTLGNELQQGDYPDSEALGQLFANAGPSSVLPIARALERSKASSGVGCGFILAIDQLEEIFSWDAQERDGFAQWLTGLLAEGRIYVLTSMRSDFQPRLLESEPLTAIFGIDQVSDGSDPVLNLKPPAPADLRDIIVQPAAIAGLKFEAAQGNLPALDRRIEAEAEHAGLPALQFLLAELYDQRDGDQLTHASYDALGGVNGVIAAQGDAAVSSLSEETLQAFPSLVRKLVSTNSLTQTIVARPVVTDALTAAEAKIAQALTENGLLVSDAGSLRLVHEALITGWDRFTRVLDSERRLLGARHRLSLASAAYQALSDRGEKSAKNSLLQGFQLAEGRDLRASWEEDAINAEHEGLSAFIAASDKADRRSRWRKRTGLGAIAAVLVSAGMLAGYLQLSASQNAIQAELSTAIANAAEASLRYEDWPTAVAEARRARALADTPPTLSLALSALLGADIPHTDPFNGNITREAAFVSDGSLASLSEASVFKRGGLTRDLESRVDTGVMFSDGSLVAGHWTGLWYQKPDRIGEWMLKETGNTSLQTLSVREFNNRFVLAAGSIGGGQGHLLRCTTSEALNCDIEVLAEHVTAVDLSNDGETVAYVAAGQSITTDTGARVRDRDSIYVKGPSGTRRVEIDWPRADDRIFQIKFMPGEKRLIWSNRDGGIYMTRADGRTQSLQYSTRISTPAKLALSADASTLAYTCEDEVICVSALEGEQVTPKRKIHRTFGGAKSLSLSQDGSQLLALLANGTTKLWDLSQTQPVVQTVPAFTEDALAISFNADRQSLVLTAPNQGVRIFRLEGEELRPHFRWKPPIDMVRNSKPAATMLSAQGHLAYISGVDPEALIYRPNARDPVSVKLETTPHRMTFSERGDLILASPFELARIKHDATEADVILTTPEGLGIGGLTAHGDDYYYALSNGALMRLRYGQSEQIVPLEQSADRLAALSLDLHPQGRFLVATRADDKVLVHDLEGKLPSSRLDIRSIDSKAVAFSPDGTMVAVLSTAGALGVWRFDPNANTALLHFMVDPVPPALRGTAERLGTRAATGMAWIDDTKIAVSSTSGDAIILSTDTALIDQGLADIDDNYRNLRRENEAK